MGNDADLAGVIFAAVVLIIVLVGIIAWKGDSAGRTDVEDVQEGHDAAPGGDTSPRRIVGIFASIGGFIGMVAAANMDVAIGSVANIDLVGWRGMLFTSAAVTFLTGMILLAVARIVDELRKRG